MDTGDVQGGAVEDDSGGLSTGVLIVIGMAITVVIALTILALWCLYKKYVKPWYDTEPAQSLETNANPVYNIGFVGVDPVARDPTNGFGGVGPGDRDLPPLPQNGNTAHETIEMQEVTLSGDIDYDNTVQMTIYDGGNATTVNGNSYEYDYARQI